MQARGRIGFCRAGNCTVRQHSTPTLYHIPIQTTKPRQYLPMAAVGGYLGFLGFFMGKAGLSFMTEAPLDGAADWWAMLSNPQSIAKLAPGASHIHVWNGRMLRGSKRQTPDDDLIPSPPPPTPNTQAWLSASASSS